MDEQSAVTPDSGRSDSARSRSALIGRDLDDIYLLLDHLSGRADKQISTLTIETAADGGGASKQNLIESVCEIEWPPVQPLAASKAATILFKARDVLNEEAWPASGMSVAFTIMVTDVAAPTEWRGLRQLMTRGAFSPPVPLQVPAAEVERTTLARAAYPHLWRPARRLRELVSIYLWMLIVSLALTAVLSWNVASGKLILERLNELKLRATVEAARLVSAQDGGGGTVAISIANSDDVPDPASTFDTLCAVSGKAVPPASGDAKSLRLNSLCARGIAIFAQRQAADTALKSWFSWWSWAALRPFPGWNGPPETAAGSPAGDLRADVRAAAIFEQQAGDVDSVLASYVLPMLYGFLGALTSVIRSLNVKMRISTLAPRDIPVSKVQLALGVIVGACIGLFVSPTGAPDARLPNITLAGNAVALSASALSFLAGFGVEAVFKWLEKLIVSAFPSGPQPAPAPPASPSRRS
jgi:hypothetical protein